MTTSPAFETFYKALKRHEVYRPTSEQVAALRAICETDYGISHDAPYAVDLVNMAMENIGADGGAGSVGYVYGQYGTLVEFVRLVQAEGKAP